MVVLAAEGHAEGTCIGDSLVDVIKEALRAFFFGRSRRCVCFMSFLYHLLDGLDGTICSSITLCFAIYYCPTSQGDAPGEIASRSTHARSMVDEVVCQLLVSF